MNYIRRFFLLLTIAAIPAMLFALENVTLTVDTASIASTDYQYLDWTSSQFGECEVRFSESEVFEDYFPVTGENIGSEGDGEDGEIYQYRASLENINFGNAYHYYVYCKFEEGEKQSSIEFIGQQGGDQNSNEGTEGEEDSVTENDGEDGQTEQQEEQLESTFQAQGPTLLSYTTPTGTGNLEYIFTANYDGTCWVQYDSANTFSNPTTFATSLIENPSTSNGNLYKYKGIITNTNPNSFYYVRALCNYGGSTYTNADIVWSASQANNSYNAATPKITFGNLEIKSNPLSSFGSEIHFNWSANIDGNCKALMSINSNYSSPSEIPAASKTKSGDLYKYSAVTPFALKDKTYYFQAVCTKDGVTTKGSWHSIKAPSLEITLENLEIKSNPLSSFGSEIHFDWLVNYDVSCKALMSISSNYSSPSEIPVERKVKSGNLYKYSIVTPFALKDKTYYLQAICTKDGVQTKSSWYSIKAPVATPEQTLVIPGVEDIDISENGKVKFTIQTETKAACGIQYSRFVDMSPKFDVRGLLSSEKSGVYEYTATTTDLKSETVYYYRPFCKNSVDAKYGAVARLKMPKINKKALVPATIESFKADGRGNVKVELHAPYEGSCAIEFSKSQDISTPKLVRGKKDSKVIRGKNHLVGYVVQGSGFDAETVYYYRPMCKYRGETVYSAIARLKTPKADTTNLTDLTIRELDDDSTKKKIAITPVTGQVRPKDVQDKAVKLLSGNIASLLKENKILRSQVREQEAKIRFLDKLVKKGQKLNERMESALSNYIAYGVDEETEKQGAGQRSSVLSSFVEVYDRLPENDEELGDVILMASGKAPVIRNQDAEKRAYESFIKIYKRVPDLEDKYDKNAIILMGYGVLNPPKFRDLQSEKNAQTSFKAIFNKLPETTEEWNNLRAITYSGAARKPDTDKDLLPDYLEKQLGSDPNVADSDGDGYLDGREYINGYSPVGPGIL